MKALLSILIIAGVIFTIWKGFNYWDEVNHRRTAEERATERAQVDPRRLPGMGPELEQSLAQATQGGARGLKAWLDEQKKQGKIEDPRLAWVELDYVVQVAQQDPVAAKQVFAAVKARTPADSPVYQRVKQLEKTFE
jgi:hypothetical protein